MDLVQLSTTKETGRKYWRSLDQLAGTSEFAQWVEREFPSSASEMLDGTSRRNLLKLMAASFGLAGLTACRRPIEKVLPNVRGAEDYVPGRPLFYNTAMSLGGAATGLTVKVNDGRPTKIEGNPNHPFSFGRANSYHQAAVLGVYDPDRATTPRADNRTATWAEIAALPKGPFSPAALGAGDGLRFLSEKLSSPSLQGLKTAALQKFPKAKWIEYDAIPHEASAQGAALAFGQPVNAVYHFDKADVVLSLDSDFLGLDAQTIHPQKTFADRRRATNDTPELNRLYVVESQFSITGANADHRLRLRSSDIRDFASDLAGEMKIGGNELKVLSGSKDEKRTKWLAAVAKDLKEHQGKSVVVAGPRQPAAVHALAFLMNQSLGNIGTTVSFYKAASDQTVSQLDALRGLVGEMSRGQVSHLVMLGGNPVYTAPADFDFPANLKKVANSVYLGFEPDETAVASKWLIPEAHFLESWGDVVAPDGTVTFQQPMIEPLFGGKTAAEVVALLTGNKETRGYDIVRAYWVSKLGGEKVWRKSLHDGVVPNTAAAPVTPTLDAKRVNAASQGTAPRSGMELVFLQSAATYDGRFANNGWLQELPDPMHKLTWDNAALLSPATARQIGVKHGDLIAIERAGRSLEAPVVVQPGYADNSIGIALGYGRTECGRIGKDVGANAYKLRTSDAFAFATDITVKKTGREYPLALTQEHNVVEPLGTAEVKNRIPTLIREATVEEFRKEPKFVQEFEEHPPLLSLYGDWDYSKGQQWGMAIDLNSCIGCNACMIACQAENNIPIVGKDQVARGREMHWIRLDRYYKGDENDPESVTQPIPCMQCENAPCENVCPVAATAHSPEGLNDMAYNRCVGTRYCSNNCPYKVRRFNFLNWHYGEAEVHKMVFNPDVTVRMRGVMEKCTFCVQRIQAKKIEAKAAERRQWLNDGEVQTACQQTCPADAIVFGNINDAGSRVAKMKAESRNYAMLSELNTKPRTTFLAKLRNPNPELEERHG